MPLPMVHLAAAWQMREHRLNAPSPEASVTPDFLLGSLAPDAIHARAGTTRADKRRTHLHLEDSREALFGRLRGFWDEESARAATEGERHFLAGYIAHVLTDALWLERVHASFRTATAGLAEDEQKNRYYRDCDRVDAILYRERPWRPALFAALGAAPARPAGDLLAAAEVGAWRLRTLGWFEGGAHDPGVDPSYITERVVDRFILQMAQDLGPLLQSLSPGWDA